MTRLVWGDPDKRFYETGVDRGVFYPQDGVGVPWNGLLAVSEAPSGADIIDGHYDGEKYRQQRQRESFAAKIRAYTYPREFEEYDGTRGGHTQQRRKLFNFSYRTKTGNGQNESYLIHLVYNAVVSPSAKNYASLGSVNDGVAFEWDLETVPEIFPSGEISAHLIINPSIAYPWAMTTFENLIYGSEDNDAHFPSIYEVIELFEDASIVRVTNHGDGTATIDGPDEAVYMISPTLWAITWPSVVQIDTNRYRITSL